MKTFNNIDDKVSDNSRNFFFFFSLGWSLKKLNLNFFNKNKT